MRAGTHHSQEAREKMSLALRGEKHPNFGKHLSPETKERLAASKRGKPRPPHVIERLREVHSGKEVSKETREKISVANSGENHPFYGKHLPDGTKQKIRASRIGKTATDETKRKMSNSQRGRKHSLGTIAKMSGENCHLWRGGISFEPYCPKFNNNLRMRVRAFFDNQCVLCGKAEVENGRRLDVHHVEYNKEACCDGMPVHFAALCRRCHSMTSIHSKKDNFNRARWENVLHRVIAEIYDGRSYYTKEEWVAAKREETISERFCGV